MSPSVSFRTALWLAIGLGFVINILSVVHWPHAAPPAIAVILPQSVETNPPDPPQPTGPSEHPFNAIIGLVKRETLPALSERPLEILDDFKRFCAFGNRISCLKSDPLPCRPIPTAPVFWPIPQSVTTQLFETLLSPSLVIQLLVPDDSAREAGSKLLSIIRHHFASITATAKPDSPPLPGCTIATMSITVSNVSFADVPRGENEAYTLSASSTSLAITSHYVWGVIRGLQTLKQAIKYRNGTVFLTGVPLQIIDAPRYGYRSFLIDTARNPIPIEFIVGLVRLMGAFKLNLLHWHLTDDHNFGLELKSHPLISRGQFWSYTQEEIRRVIHEAERVGVRVMPEVNPFSHAASWKTGERNLVPNCPNYACGNGWSVGLNVIKSETYEVIRDVLQEVTELFPDPFIHLGGDEPFPGCWQEVHDFARIDSEISAWLREHGNSIEELFSLHHSRMEPIYQSLNRTVIMWQEAWDRPPRKLHASAHILWKGPEEWDTWSPGLMKDTRSGIIYASSWYFDATCRSWHDCYTRNPMSGSESDSLWGALAAAWEVDLETFFELNILKRLVAVSEIFWSPYLQRKEVSADLTLRMNAICAGLTAHDKRSHEYFASLPIFARSGYTYCMEPSAITQRDLPRWIQRQTERDMYVCNLMTMASTGRGANCSTPYCQRNAVQEWWPKSQQAIQDRLSGIEWLHH